MYKKHTFEERLLCVERYLSGDSAKSIGKEIGIDPHEIHVYVAKYKMHGEEGLRKHPNVQPSYSLKLQVVQEYNSRVLSLPEIVVKYGVSQSSVKVWSRIAREQGYEFLATKKKRGRPSRHMNKKKKTNEPLTELEKLQAEVLYLRAENDLLKKVKALVEQREAQNKRIGREPSKN